MEKGRIVAELASLEVLYGPARRAFDSEWHHISHNIEILFDYLWRDKEPCAGILDVGHMTHTEIQDKYDDLSARYALARNLFTMQWFSVKLKIDKCSEALRLIEEENTEPHLAMILA